MNFVNNGKAERRTIPAAILRRSLIDESFLEVTREVKARGKTETLVLTSKWGRSPVRKTTGVPRQDKQITVQHSNGSVSRIPKSPRYQQRNQRIIPDEEIDYTPIPISGFMPRAPPEKAQSEQSIRNKHIWCNSHAIHSAQPSILQRRRISFTAVVQGEGTELEDCDQNQYYSDSPQSFHAAHEEAKVATKPSFMRKFIPAKMKKSPPPKKSAPPVEYHGIPLDMELREYLQGLVVRDVLRDAESTAHITAMKSSIFSDIAVGKEVNPIFIDYTSADFSKSGNAWSRKGEKSFTGAKVRFEEDPSPLLNSKRPQSVVINAPQWNEGSKSPNSQETSWEGDNSEGRRQTVIPHEKRTDIYLSTAVIIFLRMQQWYRRSAERVVQQKEDEEVKTIKIHLQRLKLRGTFIYWSSLTKAIRIYNTKMRRAYWVRWLQFMNMNEERKLESIIKFRDFMLNLLTFKVFHVWHRFTVVTHCHRDGLPLPSFPSNIPIFNIWYSQFKRVTLMRKIGGNFMIKALQRKCFERIKNYKNYKQHHSKLKKIAAAYKVEQAKKKLKEIFKEMHRAMQGTLAARYYKMETAKKFYSKWYSKYSKRVQTRASLMLTKIRLERLRTMNVFDRWYQEYINNIILNISGLLNILAKKCLCQLLLYFILGNSLKFKFILYWMRWKKYTKRRRAFLEFVVHYIVYYNERLLKKSFIIWKEKGNINRVTGELIEPVFQPATPMDSTLKDDDFLEFPSSPITSVSRSSMIDFSRYPATPMTFNSDDKKFSKNKYHKDWFEGFDWKALYTIRSNLRQVTDEKQLMNPCQYFSVFKVRALPKSVKNNIYHSYMTQIDKTDIIHGSFLANFIAMKITQNLVFYVQVEKSLRLQSLKISTIVESRFEPPKSTPMQPFPSAQSSQSFVEPVFSLLPKHCHQKLEEISLPQYANPTQFIVSGLETGAPLSEINKCLEDSNSTITTTLTDRKFAIRAALAEKRAEQKKQRKLLKVKKIQQSLKYLFSQTVFYDPISNKFNVNYITSFIQNSMKANRVTAVKVNIRDSYLLHKHEMMAASSFYKKYITTKPDGDTRPNNESDPGGLLVDDYYILHPNMIKFCIRWRIYPYLKNKKLFSGVGVKCLNYIGAADPQKVKSEEDPKSLYKKHTLPPMYNYCELFEISKLDTVICKNWKLINLTNEEAIAYGFVSQLQFEKLLVDRNKESFDILQNEIEQIFFEPRKREECESASVRLLQSSQKKLSELLNRKYRWKFGDRHEMNRSQSLPASFSEATEIPASQTT